MTLRGLLAIALVACNPDPTLEIDVHHPASSAVKQTVVTVYAGADIRCSDIEFGDRTAAALAAIAVQEVDVSAGGRIEVSRLGGKSIVARGYDVQQRFVAAGCKDLGDLSGDSRVSIETQPTAVVAIDPGLADRPFSERTILVNMTDPGGKPLDGNVSWQLTGPAGAQEPPPSAGVATRGGDATIHVDDLGMPGPQGLRVRVPWATAPLPLVTGFDLSNATTISIATGVVASRVSCDWRGHAGKPATLVCLSQANLQLHRDLIEVSWSNQRYVARTIALPDNNQFAVFVDHDGSADEPVYVVSAAASGVGSWYKLDSGTPQAKDFGDALQNVVYVAKCAGAASALVAVQSGSPAASKLQFFTPAGVAVGASQNGEVFSGGCVADVDKLEHQAVVVSGASTDAAVLMLTGGGQQMVSGAKLTGSGFVAIESRGAVEKRFVGTRLQASGTVVFEAVLAPERNGFKLVERTEVDTAGPPNKIVAGKLDYDDDTDLMWDIVGVLRRRLFQVSLAKQVDGAPLTAITSGPAVAAAVSAGDFLIVNLNGAGVDEMIVASSSAVTIYSAD